MPRDLPGLYWDAERNRYFPLSSRPPGFPPPGPSTQQAQENPPKRRKLQNRTTRHPKVSQKQMPSGNEDSDEETAESHTHTGAEGPRTFGLWLNPWLANFRATGRGRNE